MRRIIGGHFKRNGLPKRDWGSQDRAKRAADRHHARAYQCSFCGWNAGADAGRNVTIQGGTSLPSQRRQIGA